MSEVVLFFGCLYLWLRETRAFWGSVTGAYVIGLFHLIATCVVFVLIFRLHRWTLIPLLVSLSVCTWIWYGPIADIRRTKEEMDGHRRDAANDQSGTASGTSTGTLTAAGGLCAPIPAPYAITARGAIAFPRSPTVEGVEQPKPPEPDIETLEVFTKPFAGYRSWSIEDMQTPRLVGMYSYTWKPGKNHAACGGGGCGCDVCNEEIADRGGAHQAPGVACRCGFNAYSSIDRVSGWPSAETVVGGIVGWGKLVEGTNGWRSEFATVAAIYAPKLNVFLDDIVNSGYQPIMGSCLDNLPPTRAEYLADHYGVPKCRTTDEVVEETEKLAEWMAGEDLR